MRRAVVFDLDSTLADTRPRHHLSPFVDPTKTWEDYSLACGDDLPIAGTIQLLTMLHSMYDIHILTGRREIARESTEEWLEKHHVQYDALRMRRDTDHPSNLEHKLLYIEELASRTSVELIVDDWPEQCVQLEKRLNIPVLCSNPNYVDLTMSGWDDLLKSIDNGSLNGG